MELLDTHQHLILRETIGYDWTDGIPALAGREFTLADYAGLTAGRGVVGSVFMDTGVNDADYKTEARLIAGLVGSHGIRGQIASCRPEEAGFDAWLDECAGLHVVGFRRILHVVDQGISESPLFRANLRKIGAKGLPFDLCFFARQHDKAEALLRACPDQIFVLDHFGNPDVAGDGFAPWAESLRRLAAFPNLFVKFSGIAANCRPDQVNKATLQPFADHLIDCFTPARILWGSDWPVVNITSGLPDWITLTRELLAGLSDAERARIGHGTAAQVFGV